MEEKYFVDFAGLERDLIQKFLRGVRKIDLVNARSVGLVDVNTVLTDDAIREFYEILGLNVPERHLIESCDEQTIRRKVEEDLSLEDCKYLYRLLCLCMSMVRTTRIARKS